MSSTIPRKGLRRGDNEGASGGRAVDGKREEKTAGASPSEELKESVSVKGERVTMGVLSPSSNPLIESFDDAVVSGLMQEVSMVVERARTRREDVRKLPAYDRPARRDRPCMQPSLRLRAVSRERSLPCPKPGHATERTTLMNPLGRLSEGHLLRRIPGSFHRPILLSFHFPQN